VTRKKRDTLLSQVEAYFDSHLQQARGASPHTIRAYGHALRLFFLLLAKRVRRPIALLRLDDIRVDAVLAFLDHLETARRNSAVTRNSRLAAIRGFVEHLLRNDLIRAGQYQRILDLRPKRARTRGIEYLEAEQVRAIIAQPDRRTISGARDYALLLLMFNTGARVAEVLALGTDDLVLPVKSACAGKERRNASVRCGPRRRRRCVPSSAKAGATDRSSAMRAATRSHAMALHTSSSATPRPPP
jgi:site-specific recombinase XerD